MEKYLEIGEIVNTHGVKGELKVLPLTDDPRRYDDLRWVYLDRDNTLEKREIEAVKYFKSFVIVKLKDINDMDTAEKLKGLFIKIDRENAVKLPQDTYFICDLIGSDIYDENGVKLGDLKDILQTGSNDVYVVRNENNREILIPALKSVVREILIDDKKITVSLPEGLVEE